MKRKQKLRQVVDTVLSTRSGKICFRRRTSQVLLSKSSLCGWLFAEILGIVEQEFTERQPRKWYLRSDLSDYYWSFIQVAKRSLLYVRTLRILHAYRLAEVVATSMFVR